MRLPAFVPGSAGFEVEVQMLQECFQADGYIQSLLLHCQPYRMYGSRLRSWAPGQGLENEPT